MSGPERHVWNESPSTRHQQELAWPTWAGAHGVPATACGATAVAARPCLPDGEGCTKSFRSNVVPTLNVLGSFQIRCRLDLSAPRLASRRPSRGRPESTPPVPKSYPISMLQQRYSPSAGVGRWAGGRDGWPLLSTDHSRTRHDKLRIPPQCPHLSTPTRSAVLRLTLHRSSILPYPPSRCLHQVIMNFKGTFHHQHQKRRAP